MFSTDVRSGKAFAAEQKLRELKKKILGLKLWTLKQTKKDLIF